MPILTSTLVSALQTHLGGISRAELATLLNVTEATIGNWLNDLVSPSKPQVSRIVQAFADHTGQQLVQPIFEYRPIAPKPSRSTWSFGVPAHDAPRHKKELDKKHGIYIYYDSAGAVIYLGKSTSCLYTESKVRLGADLNRPLRLPKKVISAKVGTISKYMSAYQVSISSATKNIESFMLRAFANSLYNKNSGHFK